MNLESQVTNLELSKCLFEIGVKQDSFFWWGKMEDPTFDTICENTLIWQSLWEFNETCHYYKKYSAYTASELGELLGVDIHIQLSLQNTNPSGSWYCYYQPEHGTDNSSTFTGDNLADVLAQVLITKLLENQLK